jgi:hypothetical protein
MEDMHKASFIALSGIAWFCIGHFQTQAAYRNVALNSKDTHTATALPHATSNSETYWDLADNWSTDFIAVNAINGARANTSHGAAYPSWGPWMKATNPNPWLKIELDSLYEVDSVAFYIRADFNLSDSTLDHDTYWSSGTMVFSDSTKVPIKFVRKSAAQCFKFPKRNTKSLMIRDLVWRSYINPKTNALISDGWAGITELELYGQKAPVGALPRISQTAAAGRFTNGAATMIVPSLSRLSVPMGVSGLDVFTMTGKKTWSFRRPSATETETMRLPPWIGAQAVRIVFTK